MEVTSGIAQESILRPDRWNAPYVGLLRLGMSEKSHLVDYADYVAALRHFSMLMTAHSLRLTQEKKLRSPPGLNRILIIPCHLPNL